MSASLTSATVLTADSSSIPPGIANFTAPILFGSLVNWALYGVLCVQIYVYSYNFPNDRPAVKCLAYFTFLLETAQTAMNGSDVYYWFIEGFGNMKRLQNPHLGPINVPIFHAIISFVVQEYFCYRIWRLDRRLWVLCIIITMLSILQSFGSTWAGVQGIILGKFGPSNKKLILYLWTIPSALTDILIAIAMIILLSRARVIGTRFTVFVMTRVVRLTIETNALTAGVAFSCFVLQVAFPNDIYFVFAGDVIGKIYSNTLLVSLNNRIYFRDHPTRGDLVDSNSLGVPNVSHRSVVTSLRFAQAGLPSHSATMDDSSQLNTIPNMIDLEKTKDDGTSIPSEPSHS